MRDSKVYEKYVITLSSSTTHTLTLPHSRRCVPGAVVYLVSQYTSQCYDSYETATVLIPGIYIYRCGKYHSTIATTADVTLLLKIVSVRLKYRM